MSPDGINRRLAGVVVVVTLLVLSGVVYVARPRAVVNVTSADTRSTSTTSRTTAPAATPVATSTGPRLGASTPLPGVVSPSTASAHPPIGPPLPPAPPLPPPPPKPDPTCAIHSTESQVESGVGPSQESSIADIVQVECKPIFSANTVTIDATELSNACHGTLSWASPPFPPSLTGPQFTVTLDNDGNATAVVWGGPSCAPRSNRISASLNAPPFATVATTFTIVPPRNSPPGVIANPSSEVEDSVHSAVATVIQVEFPSVQAGKTVSVLSHELFSRCGALTWYGPEEVSLGGGDNISVTLDNNGNAFVVAIAGPCASGTSTITADLTTVPYTTYVGYFTVGSPRPTL